MAGARSMLTIHWSPSSSVPPNAAIWVDSRAAMTDISVGRSLFLWDVAEPDHGALFADEVAGVALDVEILQTPGQIKLVNQGTTCQAPSWSSLMDAAMEAAPRRPGHQEPHAPR